MDCVHDHQQRRIEDRYLAHIKVTKCDQLNTLLVEEAPEINQLHRTTKKYLIAEAVLNYAPTHRLTSLPPLLELVDWPQGRRSSAGISAIRRSSRSPGARTSNLYVFS